jgi:hypothetical protein
MYIIDTNNNEATAVESKTFKELNFGEVQHLQEWIAKNPNMLGEELLIIQKEFAGFDDTYERLDLLALDKSGSLVVIENKLDDSGKDVTWQALKYVSYCSTLTKIKIANIFQQYLGSDKNAENELCDFFERDSFEEIELNKGKQRIILVAANFRKEVTSTVLWLLNYGINVKCIKVTPYLFNGATLLDTEQIIPIKDAEDYQIGLADKEREEKNEDERNKNWYITRTKFWDKLLPVLNEKTDLFKSARPNGGNYHISCDSGYKNINYNIVFSKSHARVHLWVKSRKVFNMIAENKERIESKFGAELEWERLTRKNRVAYYLRGVSLYNESDWDKMVKFLSENIIKLESVFSDELKKIITIDTAEETE